MKSLLLAIALLLAPTLASAQSTITWINGALLQPNHSVPISVSASGTTQLVAAGTGTITVTHRDFQANGTATIEFVYGTGTNCGTGQTALTGTYDETVGNGIDGDATLFIPAANALCIVTTGSIAGSVSYLQ